MSSIAKRADGRSVLLGSLSERQWQEQVLEWARRGGFHGVHVVRSSIREASGRVHSVYQGIHDGRDGQDHDDRKGVPDLLLVHPGRGLLLIPELKPETGRVRLDQERWLEWLRAVHEVQAPLWRPSMELVVRKALLNE